MELLRNEQFEITAVLVKIDMMDPEEPSASGIVVDDSIKHPDRVIVESNSEMAAPLKFA